MLEPLDGMPAGTIGFRATGRVTADDYARVLLPSRRAAAEADDVRMVFAVGPEFEKFELGALAEDARAGITLGVAHRHAWKRTAVVTDVEWIVKAIHMFLWLTPGEVRVFGLDELEQAKSWVAE